MKRKKTFLFRHHCLRTAGSNHGASEDTHLWAQVQPKPNCLESNSTSLNEKKKKRQIKDAAARRHTGTDPTAPADVILTSQIGVPGKTFRALDAGWIPLDIG